MCVWIMCRFGNEEDWLSVDSSLLTHSDCDNCLDPNQAAIISK